MAIRSRHRSAAEALRLRDAGAMFDAIVSDIEMPEMDGREFARAAPAGAAWAGLPMIALSGRSGPVDVEAGREAGFTDYLAKFERDALLESLAQCLRRTDHRLDDDQKPDDNQSSTTTKVGHVSAVRPGQRPPDDRTPPAASLTPCRTAATRPSSPGPPIQLDHPSNWTTPFEPEPAR